MNRIVLLAALSLIALPGFGHKVRVDFDRSMHFSTLKTYRWVDSDTAPSSDATFPNQLMQERIIGFIDEALAARSLKRVTTGGDLLVSYKVKVTSQPLYTTFWDGGGGWDWGWAWDFVPSISTTTVQYMEEGTLVVDMVDASRRQLVYEGISTQTISSRPEKNTRKIGKAVREIFERYPPRP